jgi:hypothetical protein
MVLAHGPVEDKYTILYTNFHHPTPRGLARAGHPIQMSDILNQPPSDAVLSTVASDSGARDFDFLLGEWHVHNRRRRRPLTASAGWEEFEARSVVRAIWSGAGNLEEWRAETPSGLVQAVSFHLYDSAARQWRLHWATEHDGRVGVATVGGFERGVGRFYAYEEINGRASLLRIVWEDRGPEECRWEQSFSDDGGRTWVSDWTMSFTRDRSAVQERAGGG